MAQLCHTMPPVISSQNDGPTHAHTETHVCIDFFDKSNSKTAGMCQPVASMHVI